MVQQFLMRPIQLGLRNREDAPYSAFVTLLQFILRTGKFRGLEDLRGLTCVEEEEADFLENMRHLQVHRRTREDIQKTSLKQISRATLGFVIHLISPARGLRLGCLRFGTFHHPDWAVGIQIGDSPAQGPPQI